VRKDKKDHKKTCINCEDKYFNKTAVKKPAKKKKYAVKNWHDVAPPPNLPTEDPAIDLSGFTWIKNNYSRTTVALVRIREGEITFNAAARELYVRAWRAKQKGVVNPSLREILEVER
jgi:hypothetical protein